MFWYKKSLFAKLLIGMLISAVIPFTLSNIISYKTTSDSMENQVIQLNQNLMLVNMENVKGYLEELNRNSVTFYKDLALMRHLRSSEIAPLNLLYIKNQVDAIYNNQSEIRAVRYMSSMNGMTFLKTDHNVNSVELKNSKLTIPGMEGEDWGVQQSYEVAELGKERVLAFHKLLIDYPSPKVLGLMSLYVGLDEIGRLIQSQAGPFAEDAVFLYIQNENKQLYSSKKNVIISDASLSFKEERGAQNGELNGEKGVFIYVRSSFMDLPLTAVKFVPKATINDSANQTLSRSLVIQFVAIGFVIVFAFILSFATMAPIKRLLRSIAMVEKGNFDVDLTTGRKDELGVLEIRFQTMIRNIDDLMNREYRNRLELATAQLKMLLAQINPHFLYNTLQSIGTLALRHGSPEINDKINELGAILRYSMDLKTEVVPLQKEVEHIEHYLSLQMGRFKNKLSYTLSSPQEPYSVRVPKLILQPLVENCIVHGFEKGGGSGTLHIAIELDHRLTIRVIDNGKGFDPQKIEQIQRDYDSLQLISGKEGGIGLINVLHRLRLFYDQNFEWDITSVPFVETVVELRITIDAMTKEGQKLEDFDCR